jgi:hypothetical protein
MYLRSTPPRNKDGSEVRYLQLAHNVWDPQLRRPKVHVVYNFGREDAANREALQRLVASVSRFLERRKIAAYRLGWFPAEFRRVRIEYGFATATACADQRCIVT